MRTEESLKRELARLCKEHTALFKQVVQDATSWQRMDTIGRKTNNVLNQLTEHFPGWKDDPDRIPQFGLVGATITQLQATVAQLRKDFQKTAALQRKQIEVLIASLKEQASQIQRVSDPLELRVSDPLELSKPAPQLVADNQ